MTSPAPLFGPTPESNRISRANWLGRYLGVERDFDDRLKITLTDALDHVDDAFDSVKENFSGKVRRQQYAAAKSSMRQLLSNVFGVTNENIKQSRSEAAIAAVDAELYEERGILARIFSNPSERQQYADSLKQTASRNVENVVARTLFSERPLSARVYKTEALANNLVSQAINRGLARGDASKEIAKSVKHMIDPNTSGGISYAARRLGTTEVNNAFHATAIKTAQDVPWVEQMEWHLSKRHENDPGDECEIYAQQQYFDTARVPDKPHPFCRCFVTPKQQDYDSFENSLVSGHYDAYLDNVLGIPPEPGPLALEKWPEGTTDRVKKAYEKARAAGKTDLYAYQDKSWSRTEIKAGQKLAVQLQNEQLALEEPILEPKKKKKGKKVGPARGTREFVEQQEDTTVPETLEKAKTTPQVRNYLLDRYEGLELEGFDPDVDIRAASEIASGLTDLAEKYPDNGLGKISIRNIPNNGIAPFARTMPPDRDNGGRIEMQFHAPYVRNYDDFVAEIKEAELPLPNGRPGHVFQTGAPPALRTFKHEFGHVISHDGRNGVAIDIINNGIDPFIPLWESSTGTKYSKKTAREFQDWVKSQIPGYGNPDTDDGPFELVAEAYADTELNGEEAKPLSKFIHSKLIQQSDDAHAKGGFEAQIRRRKK